MIRRYSKAIRQFALIITTSLITWGALVWSAPNASNGEAIRAQVMKCNQYSKLISKMQATQDRINAKLIKKGKS